MFVGVFTSSKLPREPATRHQGLDAKAISCQQLAQPSGRERASFEDYCTHLRHPSSLHRHPSLSCASVEPDRPGAYGTPGSSLRLSAWIMPAIDASCDPSSSARCACVWSLLLLLPRRLSPGPGRRHDLCNTQAVVARASRDLRPVRAPINAHTNEESPDWPDSCHICTDEDGATEGVGEPAHHNDCMYSRVGTERVIAPLAPQY